MIDRSLESSRHARPGPGPQDAPTLVIGLPVYEGGEHVREALESLLAQTLDAIAIVVTDDHPDHPAAAAFAACTDPRVHYEANPRRLGLVGNWRHCFERARTLFPDAPYFAWAGDHDVRHPLWAERVVRALDAAPDAVAACSLTYRMDEDGTTLGTKRSTRIPGSLPARVRLRRAVREMAAGNMIYGVFRADALERVGGFHEIVLPDRHVLSELATLGGMEVVEERLFYRRVTDSFSLDRQRAAFWPDRSPPLRARLPWAVQHVATVGSRLLLGRTGPPGARPGERAGLAATHAAATFRHAGRRSARRAYARATRGHSVRELAGTTAVRVAAAVAARPGGDRALQLARRVLRA